MTPEELKKHPAVINFYRSRVRLSKRGNELVGRCPFHSEKTGSFTVSQKDGVWLFHCFGGGCNASGDIFSFVQKLDKVDFTTACKTIEDFCGVPEKELAEKVFQPIVDDNTRSFSLTEYRRLEDSLENNKQAQDWLVKERGITMETARKMQFGFKQDIRQFASANGITDKGWISLPVIEGDRVVAIEFRSLVRKEFRKLPGMKTATLLGSQLIDPLEPAFVCEGGFDAAILVQAGFVACSVPNASTLPSPEFLEKLNQAEYVVLAGDNGSAGNQIMEKLGKAVRTPVIRIRWPEPYKDANETFMRHCNANTGHFKTLVEQLIAKAKERPLKGIYSIQQSLLNSNHTKLVDHPDRLKFPWKSVDEMAVIVPGTVTTVFSTQSGQGKSTWVLQASIYAAKEHKQIVLNYQAEMTSHQLDTIFTSHLLHKDRLNLEEEDYRKAGKMLGHDFQYYIGRDTELTNVDQVLDLLEAGIKHYHPDIVILDNLHFVCRGTGVDVYRQQAAAMQRITNLAASYGLKFIVVHQARKADQNHKGRTNHITDMDGTKAIENDSATVINIHRDEVKHKDDSSSDSEYSPITEITLKKARDKGPGKAYTQLMFAGKVCTFSEMAYTQEPKQQEDSPF